MYDFDVSYCMVCIAEFGWFSRRHHCRVCGYVVCGSCSPFMAKIPGIPEELESRVCRNCYTGLTTVRSASPVLSSSSFDKDLSHTVSHSSGGSGHRRSDICTSPIEYDLQKNQLEEARLKSNQIEAYGKLQDRNYVIAYR